MNILISYADYKLRSYRTYSRTCAVDIGRIDKVIEYGPADIDKHFYRKNKHILKQPRLGGYGLWKPYIIKKTLNQMSENDILFYCDIGIVFTKPITPLVRLFNKLDQDVLAFGIPGRPLEKHWTKRDTFIAINCDKPKYTDTLQIQTSYHLWKKTSLSIKLADEWMYYGQDKQLITDTPSKMPNYEGFREHRHDQSIFSLLIKKYKMDVHRDFSQWEKKHGISSYYPHSTYPQLAIHFRPLKQTLRATALLYLIERLRLNEKKIRLWIKKIRLTRDNLLSLLRSTSSK